MASRFDEPARKGMRRLGYVTLYTGAIMLGTLWLCTKKKKKTANA